METIVNNFDSFEFQKRRITECHYRAMQIKLNIKNNLLKQKLREILRTLEDGILEIEDTGILIGKKYWRKLSNATDSLQVYED